MASLDSDLVLRRKLRPYAAQDLLLIDEVGCPSYSNWHADPLFELISRRYRHKSPAVTTNRAFTERGEVFPNAACMVLLIGRLMHRAEIVRIDGCLVPRQSGRFLGVINFALVVDALRLCT